MKYKYLVYLLILSAAMLYAQEQKKEYNGIKRILIEDNEIFKNSKKMLLNKEMTIGLNDTDESKMLISPRDVTTDDEGNIYIMDTRDECVKVYTPEGAFLRKIGASGQGPGEVYRLRVMDISEKYVILVGKYSPISYRCNVFFKNGEFYKSFVINGITIHDLELIDENIICTRRNPIPVFRKMSSIDYNYSAYRYDFNGKLIDCFCPVASAGKFKDIIHYALSATISRGPGEKLVIAQSNPFELYISDTAKKNRTLIHAQFKDFHPPKLIKVELGPDKVTNDFLELSSIVKVFYLSNDKILTFVQHQNSDFSNIKKSLYLFSINGKLLENYDWDLEEHLVHIDKNNNLYTLCGLNDIPYISKYKSDFLNISH